MFLDSVAINRNKRKRGRKSNSSIQEGSNNGNCDSDDEADASELDQQNTVGIKVIEQYVSAACDLYRDQNEVFFIHNIRRELTIWNIPMGL